MAKLWAGRTAGDTSKLADDFNSSISFDSRMYRQDITGSMAHAAMLGAQGIIPQEEARRIIDGLQGILDDLERGALAIDPAASLEALSSEFQKFIDGYTKEPVSISFDDHFRSRGLEKIKRFARIGAGLRFLHDQAGMAAQVEARFPERQYSCTYEWSEYGVDGGDAIECDSVELIALWGK